MKSEIKRKIKEANDFADDAIKQASGDSRAWYRKPVRISNGQAVMIAMIFLLAFFSCPATI